MRLRSATANMMRTIRHVCMLFVECASGDCGVECRQDLVHLYSSLSTLVKFKLECFFFSHTYTVRSVLLIQEF